MWLLAQVLFLAGSLAVSRSQFNPCSPAVYNELNEPHRSTGYQTGYPEAPICDIHLPEGWYRFTSQAGGEMPTTCPDRLKCGTVVPIWMKGFHPTVADDIVMREACGNFNTGSGSPNPCCEHKVDIAVKNCTGFYVYYLSPPPSCPVAYCAGDIPPCPLGKWSPTGFAPCKDAHPQLKTRPILTGPIILNNTFEFHCGINWPQMDPDQRFEVVWTFEGKEDPTMPPQILQDPERSAKLDGTLLRGHLNTNVGCQVRTFYDGNQAQMSGALTSNTFYAGIMMNPAKLVVSEREFEEEITITSTVPVLCDHNTECCITFKLDTDATSDISVQTMCDYKLCDTDWDAQRQEATLKVPIVANQDMIKDGDKQLLLTFEDLIPAGGGPYHRVFEGHQPSQIQVDVKDQDTSRCTMTGDPHIHGFDFATYHLYKTGDFVAYEVKSRDFQVMIRTWACGRVACICGVTIRERNDVIKISECDQAIHGAHTSPTVEIANKLSEGTIVQRSRNGKHIGVYLPSGTEVKLDVTNSYMNMFITAPGTDKNRAFGLCGTNDGNPTNEFTNPDGTTDPVCPSGSRACIPNSFEEAWRSASRDSLFENVPPVVPIPPSIKYCACKDNHHGAPTINCTIRTNTPTSRTACNNCPTVTNRLRPNFLNGQWTKRAAVFEDVDLPDAPYVQVDVPAIDPHRKWPNDQGVTEGHALALCNQAIYKSQLVAKCNALDSQIKDSFVTDCLADILHGGTTEFLDAITDAFTVDCQQTLAKEPSSYVSDPITGEQVLKPEFLGDICQTDCLEHGHCGPHGKCICKAGWEGDSCHMKAGQGPQLDKIRSGPLCDKSQRPCKRVFIDATNLDLSDDLACKIQEVDEQGSPLGKAIITEADFVSGTRISCELPETAVSSKNYQVSATNDGALYGNSLNLLVFDGTCLNCDGAGCTEKLTACHISEVCYNDGQLDKTDSSRQCVVAQNRTEWTMVPTTPRPELQFYPTLSGPNIDFLMTCQFHPSGNVTGDATIRWLVDGQELKSENLSAGTTEAFISTAQLPTAGKLACEVGMGNAASLSGSVNLALIKH